MKRFVMHGLILIFMFWMFISLFGGIVFAEYSDKTFESDSFGYQINMIDSDADDVFVYGEGYVGGYLNYFVCSYDQTDGTENFCQSDMTSLFYFGINDTYIYTLSGFGSTIQYRSKVDGTVVGTFSTGGSILVDGYVDNDYFYAADNNDKLRVIDLTDNSLHWEYDFTGYDYGASILRSTMYSDGTDIYLPFYEPFMDEYFVESYSILDGTLNWISDTFPSEIRAILVDDSNLYLGGVGSSAYDGYYAYDLTDGSFNYQSDNYFGYIYSLESDGFAIYVGGTGENKVISYDPLTGDLYENFPSYGAAIRSMSISNDMLFVGGLSSIGEVHGYDISPYEITFETNGGSLISSQYVYSTDLIEQPIPPTKAGFIFAGWYVNIGLTVPWDFGTDYASSDQILYADWDVDVYSVVFNPNGGTAVSDYYGISYGSTITRPTSPTRTNYNFIGWYSDSELTQEWNFNQDEVTEDLILYAKWRQDIGPSISDWFGDIGFDSSWGKLFVSFVLIIGVIVLLAHLGATAPIITFVTISLFVLLLALNFIPLWIGIAVMIVQFAFLFITLKGGGGSGED